MLYFSLRGSFVPPNHFRLSWLFESLHGRQQPLSQCALDLLVGTGPVQTVHRLTRFIQRNVSARNGFVTAFFRHKIHQNAVGLWTGRPSMIRACLLYTSDAADE